MRTMSCRQWDQNGRVELRMGRLVKEKGGEEDEEEDEAQVVLDLTLSVPANPPVFLALEVWLTLSLFKRLASVP